MKKIIKINSLMVILVLIFNVLFPVLSIATEDSVTITFQDENLYNAILEQIGSKIESSDDSTYTINITQSNLETITRLNISNKHIYNLDGIEKFTFINYLSLACNDITDVSRLSTLTNLEELYLVANDINDISPLINLQNLKVLDLTYNKLTDITPLSSLVKLEKVCFGVKTEGFGTGGNTSTNRIENIDALADLKNLEYLNMGGVGLKDVTGLRNLTNLKTLIMSYNDVEDISVFGYLSNLEVLSLDSNKVKDFEVISGLTNLKVLSLYNMGISNISFIENLTNLEKLSIAGNNISDITSLRDMVNLRELSIASNSKIDDISVFENFEKLQRISIANNDIEDISVLEKLDDLEQINLGGNRIKDLSYIDKDSIQLNTSSDIRYEGFFSIIGIAYVNNSQNIEINANGREIELPPIFIQAKDRNSKMYTEDEFELVNCSLSEDGKKIVLDEEISQATITIKGGAIDGSKLTVNVVEGDIIPPVLDVQYSNKEMTKEPVIVTITANEQIQELAGWTLSNDAMTLTKEYSKNIQDEITVLDLQGNGTKTTISVNNIDTTPPQAKTSYSTTITTNKNVTVTIVANEKIQEAEGWNLSNDQLTLTKEFFNNTEEELTIYDLVGNETKIPIRISNIDKTEPNIEASYSTKELTKETITVEIKADERVQQVEGWCLEEDGMTLTKVYAKNIQEEITVLDLAGNESKITISINNIDTIAPEADIQYSTTKLTNKNVTVTIIVDEQIQEVDGWTLTNDKTTLTKEFLDNTEEEITIYDLAGNERNIPIRISNIDKITPNTDAEYSTKELTNGNVTVTISADEEIQEVEGWTISLDRKTLVREYEKNTQESVVLYDLAGNSTTEEILISNIDKDAPELEITYSTVEKTEDSVTVKIQADEEIREVGGWKLQEDRMTLTKVYSSNIKEKITVYDLAGNEIKQEIVISNILEEDTTVAEAVIPKAGKNVWILASIILVIMLMTVLWKKYNNLKDVR